MPITIKLFILITILLFLGSSHAVDKHYKELGRYYSDNSLYEFSVIQENVFYVAKLTSRQSEDVIGFTVSFTNGKFVENNVLQMDVVKALEIRKSADKKILHAAEEIGKFRSAYLKESTDFILWKILSIADGRKIKVSLKNDDIAPLIILTKVEVGNSYFIFENGVILEIKQFFQNTKEYLLVHLFYCGGSGCSSEIVALEEE